MTSELLLQLLRAHKLIDRFQIRKKTKASTDLFINEQSKEVTRFSVHFGHHTLKFLVFFSVSSVYETCFHFLSGAVILVGRGFQ